MLMIRKGAYAPRSTMAPHFHAEMSFSVVVRGAYVERIAGREVELGPGHMVLYPAEEMHSQQFGVGGARQVIFTPGADTIDSLRECGISVDRPRHTQAMRIAQLGERLWREAEHDDGFGHFAAEGLALELLALFGRRQRRVGKPPAWLTTARDLVTESIDEPLTVDDLATRVGRHPVHLAREFQRFFGASIGEFRRQVRLRRAEELLRTKLGLSAIALACGFSSHSHFSRAFTAAYGVSPSELRSRLRA
jgi:AraC family transcriptional regulator